MPMPTPQESARKWAANLSAATQAIRTGVDAVTESPTEKAAAAADRYLSGVQAAIASGKYQRGLQRVTLSDWKSAMINKGIPRIATGAAAAVSKFERFMADFLPHIAQVRASLPPRGDLETNIARMNAMVRGMSEFKRS